MSKKVLVTGGGGYIGSTLVRHLLIQGYQVKVLDNCSMGSDGVMSFLGYPTYSFIRGDIRDLDIVNESMKDIEFVVHLAAIVGEPACRRFKDDAKTINLDGTMNIFNSAVANKVKRFVFFSTCSSYGVQDTNVMANEETELNPVSLYAETKIQMEEYIKKNIPDDMSYTVMRPSTVHGPSPRMRFDLIVNHLVKDAVVHKKLEIFGGNLWRPLMWVGEAGRAVEKALSANKEIIHNQVFNLGNTENNVKKKEIAEIIKSKFMPDLDIQYQNEDEDLRSYRVDFSKIEKSLDFKLQKTLDKAIEELFYLCSNSLITDYESIKYRNH
tara:strand:- start:1005 stop:1979 length:975 start_codon:yes stop_codon:yes gene_type:complete